MQFNEELVRQITNAVLDRMQQTNNSSAVSAKQDASGEVPSLAGRERINEVASAW